MAAGLLSAAFLLCALILPRAQNAFSPGEIRVPILMYHHLTTLPRLAGKYSLPVEQFRRDLADLQEQGYTSITMSQLIGHVKEGSPLPKKPVIITFDDGNESFYTYAYPLLQEYNMCAVLGVVGAYADKYTLMEDHNPHYSYASWDELKEMGQSGYVELQNHSYDLHGTSQKRKGCHMLPEESPQEYLRAMREDVGLLQDILEKKTGSRPNTMVYPFGSYSGESAQAMRQLGFQAALTCEERINVVRYDDDFLFHLGRFNRPNGLSSEAFFRKILS
ncbi:MAG: polysaccharide deacetylase family protein [Eubacteriales bacterium]|nr:polysaccharide deacetylase family protein [Eubacteriales bacterium]